MKAMMIKKQIIFGFSFVLAVGCSEGQSETVAKEQVGAVEFQNLEKEYENEVLLDVRTPEEFATGHLRGATNIDWNSSSFETEIKKLDKNKPVLIYCRSGRRSAAAADKMRSIGFTKVIELEGGILDWQAKNLPIE